MSGVGQELSYSDGHDTMLGMVVTNASSDEPKPGILVAPAFGGRGPVEEAAARRLADLGYSCLIVDYYGEGRTADSPDDAFKLMSHLNDNRDVLARRMTAALDALKALPSVDDTRVGGIGFCLGGKAILDLARTGAAFQAGVALHGVFDAPPSGSTKMNASLLILHGWNDPLAKPDAVIELATELTEHCEDWQILAFGHTTHGFTNPEARTPGYGVMYSERSTDRSWTALQRFLQEKLG